MKLDKIDIAFITFITVSILVFIIGITIDIKDFKKCKQLGGVYSKQRCWRADLFIGEK